MTHDIDTPAIDAVSADQQAVLDALAAVFVPLAQLCTAKGIRIHAVEERLRSAFVAAARDAHPNQLATRLTSRISATTGLTRREVARLQSDQLKEGISNDRLGYLILKKEGVVKMLEDI